MADIILRSEGVGACRAIATTTAGVRFLTDNPELTHDTDRTINGAWLAISEQTFKLIAHEAGVTTEEIDG